jgi:hypothetical protein
MHNDLGTSQHLESGPCVASVPLLPALASVGLLLGLVIHQDSRCGYCMRF